MQSYAGNSIVDRMIRAAKLQPAVYEELERDTNATSQALTVVVIVAVAAGIGGALSVLTGPVGGVGAAVVGFITGVITAVIGWAIWSFVTYFVGTNLMGGKATYGELLRTVGFAYSPNILGIFSFIPVLGGLVALIGGIWALVAGVVAVRQALDIDTGKAIITVIISVVVIIVVFAILALIFGGMFALAGMGR